MSETHQNNSGYQTGHLGLNVSNLDRSKDFYGRVFGLQLMGESREEGRRFAFLGYGDNLVLTLWQQSEGRFEKRRPGLHHLSFQASSLEEVQRVERTVRELNAPLLYDGIVPHQEHASSGGLYFEDPDGIRLEIYAPAGADVYAAPTPGAPSCGLF